jgi:hypothetical protein
MMVRVLTYCISCQGKRSRSDVGTSLLAWRRQVPGSECGARWYPGVVTSPRSGKYTRCRPTAVTSVLQIHSTVHKTGIEATMTR